MKRFGSSDSLGPFSYPQEDNMQMIMDSFEDEESMEEMGHVSGKKRRLAVEQVQSLEKIFEVDNKLDPERKIKVAQELGLQPRQVAIWFQNRRARWKTKQLERDYNHLKADYENLQHSFSEIEQEKQNLVAELKRLKEKLGGQRESDEDKLDFIFPGISGRLKMATNVLEINEVPELKDGSSDESDNSSNELLKVQNNHCPKILSDSSCFEAPHGMCLSSSMYYPQFLDSRPLPPTEASHHYHHHQQQLQQQQQQQQLQQHNAKMENLSQFGVDESCNIFSVDQSHNTLYWYYPDQRI
ncbi:homeodomain transcription factor [Lithospermum erythrorhizon]|uniref:Homeobox-leucine zipper protein n=1 Tax=Lithospermum erythrorhizon TaxID=34254 RepID=A0AAV3NSG4_LITER